MLWTRESGCGWRGKSIHVRVVERRGSVMRDGGGTEDVENLAGFLWRARGWRRGMRQVVEDVPWQRASCWLLRCWSSDLSATFF